MSTREIKAWTITKVGEHRASSDYWSVRCMAETKTEAIARMKSCTGESWSKLRAAGFRTTRIKILLETE